MAQDKKDTLFLGLHVANYPYIYSSIRIYDGLNEDGTVKWLQLKNKSAPISETKSLNEIKTDVGYVG